MEDYYQGLYELTCPFGPSTKRTKKLKLEILFEACGKGRLDVVKHLVNKGVDPSRNQNRAVRYASKNGRLSVVSWLLKDPRVNPSDLQNNALSVACAFGHVDVVDCLLQDCRVNPGHLQSRALYDACCCGHLVVVNRLLREYSVDPSKDKAILGDTCEQGHIHVVERLLQDPRLHIRASEQSITMIQDAISGAHCYGHSKLIDMLMHPCLGGGMWYEPVSDRGFYIVSRSEYAPARKKWYVERAEQFRELHTELVASSFDLA